MVPYALGWGWLAVQRPNNNLGSKAGRSLVTMGGTSADSLRSQGLSSDCLLRASSSANIG
jgi:hypothetical protein